jgi:hypothetical protein
MFLLKRWKLETTLVLTIATQVRWPKLSRPFYLSKNVQLFHRK